MKVIKGIKVDDICDTCEHVKFDESKNILDGKGKILRYQKCDITKSEGYMYIVTQEALDDLRKCGCVKIDEIEKRKNENH